MEKDIGSPKAEEAADEDVQFVLVAPDGTEITDEEAMQSMLSDLQDNDDVDIQMEEDENEDTSENVDDDQHNLSPTEQENCATAVFPSENLEHLHPQAIDDIVSDADAVVIVEADDDDDDDSKDDDEDDDDDNDDDDSKGDDDSIGDNVDSLLGDESDFLSSEDDCEELSDSCSERRDEKLNVSQLEEIDGSVSFDSSVADNQQDMQEIKHETPTKDDAPMKEHEWGDVTLGAADVAQRNEAVPQTEAREHQLVPHADINNIKTHANLLEIGGSNSEAMNTQLVANESLNTTDAVCGICDQFFHDKIELRNHMACHDSTSLIDFIMNKQAVNKEHSQEMHSNMYNEEGQFQYQAAAQDQGNVIRSPGSNVDDHTSNLISGYDGQKTTNNATSDETFQSTALKCNLCNKEFINKQWLEQHHKDIHSGPYECAKCEKAFPSLKLMKLHVAMDCSSDHALIETDEKTTTQHKQEDPVVIQPEDSVYSCRSCKYTTSNISNLKSHMTKHSNVRRFMCNACNKAFKRKGDLRKHSAICPCRVSSTADHGGPAQEGKYSCTLCNRVFDTKFGLSIHARGHNVKTYNCTQCGKAFKYKEALRKHEISCAGRNPAELRTAGGKLEDETPMASHMHMHYTNDGVHGVSDKNVTEQHQQGGAAVPSGSSKERKDKSTLSQEDNVSLFACQLCSYVTSDKSNLKSHMMKHSDERRYSCPTCKRAFKRKGDMRKHVTICPCRVADQGRTPQEGNYPCTMCNRVFTSKFGLSIHARGHNTKMHTCTKCGKSYEHKYELRQHQRNSLCRNSEIEFKSLLQRKNGKCALCGVRFADEVTLSAHMATVHRVKTHKCPICDEEFVLKKHLTNHMRMHIEGKQQHVCKICGKEFGTKYFLKKHQASTAGACGQNDNFHNLVACTDIDVESKITEQQMDGVDMEQSTSKTHDISNVENYAKGEVTPSDANSYGMEHACGNCGKRYKSQQSLIVHYTRCGNPQYKPRSVTPARVAKCHQCNESFRSKGYLRAHMAEAHNQALHRCNMCERAFLQEQQLIKHMQSHSNKKPHACDECGEKFDTAKLLKVHRIQSIGCGNEALKPEDASQESECIPNVNVSGGDFGEKKYDCDMCHKTFRTLSNLQQHRVRHEERTQKCNLCEKKFYLKSELESHKKTHLDKSERVYHMCDICGKQFTRLMYMKYHRRLHSNEEKYKCHFCGRAFTQHCHLLEHVNRHEDKKNYMCDLCGKQFSRKYSMQKHRRRPHPIRDDKTKNYGASLLESARASAKAAATATPEMIPMPAIPAAPTMVPAHAHAHEMVQPTASEYLSLEPNRNFFGYF